VNGRYISNDRFRTFTTRIRVDADGKAAPVCGSRESPIRLRLRRRVYGERHGTGRSPAELKLLRALVERDAMGFVLEQFERDVQGIVDDYMALRIGETIS